MRRAALFALPVLLAACSEYPAPQHFVVFYPEPTSALDTPSRAITAIASDWATKHARKSVVVTGFADPPGAFPRDRDQSRERVRSVIDDLERHGVPPARIVVAADEPDDVTVARLERRRVFIDVTR